MKNNLVRLSLDLNAMLNNCDIFGAFIIYFFELIKYIYLIKMSAMYDIEDVIDNDELGDKFSVRGFVNVRDDSFDCVLSYTKVRKQDKLVDVPRRFRNAMRRGAPYIVDRGQKRSHVHAIRNLISKITHEIEANRNREPAPEQKEPEQEPEQEPQPQPKRKPRFDRPPRPMHNRR